MERTKGRPSEAFLLWHGLDERSHLTLTQPTNIEDAKAAYVTGDEKTKFRVANWAAYSNLKAAMVNAGEEGHIFEFEGKFKCDENDGCSDYRWPQSLSYA